MLSPKLCDSMCPYLYISLPSSIISSMCTCLYTSNSSSTFPPSSPSLSISGSTEYLLLFLNHLFHLLHSSIIFPSSFLLSLPYDISAALSSSCTVPRPLSISFLHSSLVPPKVLLLSSFNFFHLSPSPSLINLHHQPQSLLLHYTLPITYISLHPSTLHLCPPTFLW